MNVEAGSRFHFITTFRSYVTSQLLGTGWPKKCTRKPVASLRFVSAGAITNGVTLLLAKKVMTVFSLPSKVPF